MTQTIAIAGFLHETNTFVEMHTTYADFSDRSPSGRIYFGDEVSELYSVNSGVAGCVEEARKAGFDVLPLLWCEAEPGGLVTRDAFERILGVLEQRLADAGSIDGLYLELHGAMLLSQPKVQK